MEEEVLAGPDVIDREDHSTARVDDPVRARRLDLIDAKREEAKNEEADKGHQTGGLEPTLGYQKRSS